MLTRIKIEKLFDLFDYDIELKPEGITILTGPNGYGKTTILKILNSFASENKEIFISLAFKKITLSFSDREDFLLDQLQLNECFPKNAANTSVATYFIREQRLLLPRSVEVDGESLLITAKKDNTLVYSKPIGGVSDTFDKAIEEYARELSETLQTSLANSSQVSQSLDASFPRRLFDQEESISEDQFNQRFEKIKSILKKLAEYGLSDTKEDSHPTYKQENAKALAVYIDDAEHKLSVFSELLNKLAIFTEILNEHRFTFKRITISKHNGFKFTTNQGKCLELTDLSSGEQQEVVLLYELLFKVKPESLVLIDEPELSLHVAWQKQFIDDLLSIIELQKINVIIATHSPQIINNRWDLTVDLEENFQAQSVQCDSI